MNVLIFIPGFGKPFYDKKINWLVKNLFKITCNTDIIFDIKVCVYDDSDIEYLKNEISYFTQIRNIDIISDKQIVGNFLKLYCNPSTLIDNYSHILILIDDIELTSYDINYAIKCIDDFKLDIFSPSLTTDSIYGTPHMFYQKKDFKIRGCPACELFCYLMPINSYKKYYEHIDSKNPWLWGLDILLYYQFKLVPGISNVITMKHHLRNSNKQDTQSFNNYLSGEDGYWYTLNKYNIYDDKPILNQPTYLFIS